MSTTLLLNQDTLPYRLKNRRMITKVVFFFVFLSVRYTMTDNTFRQLSYSAIVADLLAWEKEYPNLVTLDNAQDAFGVASPGTCDNFQSCKQYFIRLTNKRTLPDVYRPEIFLSGALHGNERVGPTAVVEFARLLLENYVEKDTTKQNRWLKYLVDTFHIHHAKR